MACENMLTWVCTNTDQVAINGIIYFKKLKIIPLVPQFFIITPSTTFLQYFYHFLWLWTVSSSRFLYLPLQAVSSIFRKLGQWKIMKMLSLKVTSCTRACYVIHLSTWRNLCSQSLKSLHAGQVHTAFEYCDITLFAKSKYIQQLIT